LIPVISNISPIAAVAGNVTVRRPALFAIMPLLTVKFRLTVSTVQDTPPPHAETVIEPAPDVMAIPGPG
ncbi:hypothetical protein MEO41_27800, partial [Dolichospermum sp. ST_sed4]|nr:hypothetical protein [Dolichospermum sp. ST_sed4]